MKTVNKFGGDLLSSAAKMVKIMLYMKEKGNQVIVTSALGECGEYERLTPMLHNLWLHVKSGKNWSNVWEEITERMSALMIELELSHMLPLLDEVKQSIINNLYRDFIEARGEFMTTQIMTELFKLNGLDAVFIDSADCIVVGDNGVVNDKLTFKKIQDLVGNEDRYVFISGFFGATTSGRVKLLGYDGTDLSATIVSTALKIECIIWKTVDGISTADPRIVDNTKVIQEINTEQSCTLAQSGASVLHEKVMRYILKYGTKVSIRNFEKPSDKYTTISCDFPKKEGVFAITGRSNVTRFTVKKFFSDDKIGFGRKIFQVIEKLGLPYKDELPGNGIVSFFIETKNLNPKEDMIDSIMSGIQKAVKPDEIFFTTDQAIVNIEGYKMKSGVLAKAVHILDSNQITKHVTHDDLLIDEVFIIVNSDDYQRAIQKIYNGFF